MMMHACIRHALWLSVPRLDLNTISVNACGMQIHTGKMAANSFLGADVDLWDLAQRTKNFSGAEIEGLVKSATSFALNRQVDVNDLAKPIDEASLKVSSCSQSETWELHESGIFFAQLCNGCPAISQQCWPHAIREFVWYRTARSAC